MCDRFNRNREKFVDLVFNLKRFSEKEIVEAFKRKQHGDIVIDGSQTISQYLNDLREQGVLQYSHGKFLVKEFANV